MGKAAVSLSPAASTGALRYVLQSSTIRSMPKLGKLILEGAEGRGYIEQVRLQHRTCWYGVAVFDLEHEGVLRAARDEEAVSCTGTIYHRVTQAPPLSGSTSTWRARQEDGASMQPPHVRTLRVRVTRVQVYDNEMIAHFRACHDEAGSSPPRRP